jgi:hypothetical protein
VKYFFLGLAVSVLIGQPLDGEAMVKVLGRERRMVFMDQVGVPVGPLLVPSALDENEAMADGDTMVVVTVVVVVPLLKGPVVRKIDVAVVVVVDTVVVVSHLEHGVVEDIDEFMLNEELIRDVDEGSMLNEELVRDVDEGSMLNEELAKEDEEVVGLDEEELVELGE